MPRLRKYKLLTRDFAARLCYYFVRLATALYLINPNHLCVPWNNTY